MDDVWDVGARIDSKPGGRHRGWTRWNVGLIAVLVLGVMSLAVLIFTDQISQRQRLHYELGSAIADLQIRVATTHLWLEEATADEAASGRGGTTWRETMARAKADLRDARIVADAVLHGGPGLEGDVVTPTRDPELRAHAEHVVQLLTAWEAIVRQRSERPEFGREGSLLEQRSDEIFSELQRGAAVIRRIVRDNTQADYARSRRLEMGIVLAWSLVMAASCRSLWRRERRRREAEAALRLWNDTLELRVADRTRDLHFELGKHRETEAALRESETQLRRLSTRLLTTQEAERRRIATELHDEVGHALILIKLRLGVVRKALRNDQAEARDDCKHLAQSIDQLIEDIRRLTRELRPTVLEDLGLAGALRWLAGNCSQGGQLDVTASVMDIDALIGADAQIVLYRIVQEALTNVRKHAQARRVSLSVDTNKDRLAVVVEDDGTGFDAEALASRRAADRGLGLATMEERARMLGGSLLIASAMGKGTRLTLRVPVPLGGGR